MGIDITYEAPESPELHILADQEKLDKISSLLLAKVGF
jgi:adenylylsulfate kinase-like enzyme